MRRPLVVVPWGDCLQAIESLRIRAVAEISSCMKTSARIVAPSNRLQTIESSSLWVVTRKSWGIKALSCFAIGLLLSGCATFVIEILCKYIGIMLMLTFIPSECFVDDKCIHLLLVNFSCRRVNYLSGYWKRMLLLHHLEDALTRFSSLPLSFLLVNLGTQPLGPTYFFYTIL